MSWYANGRGVRQINGKDSMQGSYLGPRYGAEEIRRDLDKFDAVFSELADEELFTRLAVLLEQGKVIGWFQGRMEFGPRALGGTTSNKKSRVRTC